MSLPYTKIVRRDLDNPGVVVAAIRELPGCVAHGQSDAEALKVLAEVQRAWIEECLDSRDPVPLPEAEEQLPSGKWVQRVPRSLHKRLTERAKREDVSLNTLVTAILSEAIAIRKPARYDKQVRDRAS
jgi:predicted RNase H-like HicB family nuclease